VRRAGILHAAAATGAACIAAVALPAPALGAATRLGPDQRSVSAVAIAGGDVLWTTRAARGVPGRLFRRDAGGRLRSIPMRVAVTVAMRGRVIRRTRTVRLVR
jgi:hypothetical protein